MFLICAGIRRVQSIPVIHDARHPAFCSCIASFSPSAARLVLVPTVLSEIPGSEQLGQSLGGAFLEQKMSDIQVEEDRSDPRAGRRRSHHTLRGLPQLVALRPQRPPLGLMLGDLDRHRGKVEHLPVSPCSLHASPPRPAHGPGFVPEPLIRGSVAALRWSLHLGRTLLFRDQKSRHTPRVAVSAFG